MTLDHIIIVAIVGAVLFYTVRSLVRTWRGDSAGGCAGCPGCKLGQDDKNCSPKT